MGSGRTLENIMEHVSLVLIDYAAIAVLLYITLTILSRAVIIGLYAYVIREFFKSESSSTSSVKSDQFNPNYEQEDFPF